jgi:hypothetical protein
MRPLEPKVLPTTIETGPVALMLFAAYGGLCAICETPINDSTIVIDVRTGLRAPDRYDPERWPHLLLLCHSCFDAHQRRPTTATPPDLLLPLDRSATGIAPDAELTYDERPITVQQEYENGATTTRQARAVIAFGHTDRARRTIDHFALNGPFFIDANTLRVPYGDPRQTRDGRMRARLNAWQAGLHVAASIGAAGTDIIDATTPWANARMECFRELLSRAGCWSTSMTAIWRSHASLALMRRLYDNAHPGIVERPRDGGTSARLLGASVGNEWAGTRRTWFDDLDAALAARR